MNENATIINQDTLTPDATENIYATIPAMTVNLAAEAPAATTMVNPALEGPGILENGSVILDRFVVVNRLNIASGKADLYIVQHEGRRFVAKIYKSKLAIKPEMAEILKNIKLPCVARLYEVAEHNGFPVEIIPYYANGSLQGRTFTLEELKSKIIPAINQGLAALHGQGMLHKDLKPSNIMLTNDGNAVSLIDFGISSVKAENATVIVTKTGLTPEYSAPETFRNLFLEESDYYAFGITLFELFCGYTPYANMNADEIARYVSLQHIPMPESMPRELQNLITGLTYYDITKQHDRRNPHRRWTYKEVERWLTDEYVPVPGQGLPKAKTSGFPVYTLAGQTFDNLEALTHAMATNWNDGKKELFHGHLTRHFQEALPEIADICTVAETEAQNAGDQDDLIYWQLLYKLNSEMRTFYWQGQVYESLAAMGRDMLEHLWNNKPDLERWWHSILNEKLLSAYVEVVAPDNQGLKMAVGALEHHFRMELNEHTDLRKTYFLMAYLLSGQRILGVGGQRFRGIEELALFLQDLLDNSVDAFQKFCHVMVDLQGDLNVQMEAWLLAQGKQAELAQWQKLMAV